MLKEIVINIFKNSWPMILIFTTILSTIRITYLAKNKQPFIFYKEMLTLAFVIYILCLFYVVTFQDVSWSTSNFIPFKEMFRYQIGSNLFYRNVIGNMIMFMPYGFFISHFLKLEKPWSAFWLTVIASTTIEFTQLAIGRVFDIDDIFLNIVGGLLGFLCYKILMQFHEKLPSILKNQIFYNIIMVIILLGILLYFQDAFVVGGITWMK